MVDDNVLIREALRGGLKEFEVDATVLEASSCSHAMQLIAEHPNFDLILLDLSLPDRDGFTVLSELSAIRPFRRLYCPPSGTAVTLPALPTSAPLVSFRNQVSVTRW